MVESDACYWCDRWDREVGRYFDRTAEAQEAPLRRINLFDGLPRDLEGIAPIRATPTFVLVEHGEEVGRIVGYPGQRAFWIMLQQMLVRR